MCIDPPETNATREYESHGELVRKVRHAMNQAAIAEYPVQSIMDKRVELLKYELADATKAADRIEGAALAGNDEFRGLLSGIAMGLEVAVKIMAGETGP